MRAPKHFTDHECTIWDATIEQVPRLTPLALQRLEAYCVERARCLEAEAWIRDNGTVLTLRSDKGIVTAIREAPQLKIARQASAAALQLADKLNLRAQ